MKRIATCLAWVTLVSVLSAGPGAGASTQTPPGSDRNASGLNVRNFGAQGDEKTDDTAAFLRALDACQQTDCGSVYVPSGRYLIKTSPGDSRGGGAGGQLAGARRLSSPRPQRSRAVCCWPWKERANRMVRLSSP